MPSFDAALRLRRVGSIQFKLLLVGDGPTRKAAEELAQQLRISNDVVFVGTVPYEQIREIVSQEMSCSWLPMQKAVRGSS
jgi:hypothetical protein